MMDILLSFAPEAVALLLAVAVAYFKTSDTAIVRKIARKAEANDEEIVGAIGKLVDKRNDENRSKKPPSR